MNRLQSELHRLYMPPAANPGGVRLALLELAAPADWSELAKVWRGVQLDLQLPAPAIAVSGSDGMQLWFSLQAPASASQAAAFLERLRARYLPGVEPGRVRLLPSAAGGPFTVPPIPAQSQPSGNWSAFVAPDLAPVFAEAPWLDIQPGAEGQADLLARLESIKPAAFDAAMQALPPGAPDATTQRPPSEAAAGTPDVDPKQFLQRVLNDETVDLALRIEAAKALLQSR